MAKLNLPSLHTMRLNIWRALLCATDTEIHEGMSFYHGAYGLCRFISQALTGGAVSVRQVAGIYAALSPLNGWETNVANTLTAVRWVGRDHKYDCVCEEPWPVLVDHGFVACDRCGQNHSIHTNTSRINQRKALDIATGAEPLEILKGRKVTAFFKSIADPLDTSHIPVDRHLICLALGTKITSNQELRSFASNRQLYLRIESVYSELGERERLGNRLASIAWFVQRRIASGQQLLPHPDSPYCCSRPMQRYGLGRFYCRQCKSLRYPIRHSTLNSKPPIGYIDNFPISLLNNRKIVSLPRDHRFANKWGFQYLSRYLVMRETGQLLRKDEHVDHINQDKLDDRLDNYRVMLAEPHGRHHGHQAVYLAELAGGRGPDGRFTVYKTPIDLTSEVPF